MKVAGQRLGWPKIGPAKDWAVAGCFGWLPALIDSTSEINNTCILSLSKNNVICTLYLTQAIP